MLKASLPNSEISQALQKAITLEIRDQAQKESLACQEQIQNLQAREKEALDSLVAMEHTARSLEDDLKALQKLTATQRETAEKNQAIQDATIARLEKDLRSSLNQIQELSAKVEAARIAEARALLRAEQFEKAAHDKDKHLEKSRDKLSKAQTVLADSEKRAAVAKQQVMDLRKILAKAESRIKSLEKEKT